MGLRSVIWCKKSLHCLKTSCFKTMGKKRDLLLRCLWQNSIPIHPLRVLNCQVFQLYSVSFEWNEGLLLKMARLLVQRKQTIRDEAKNVYVSMASSLGSAHLTFCLRSLISALSMKGYTAHVLDHAIYAVRFLNKAKSTFL